MTTDEKVKDYIERATKMFKDESGVDVVMWTEILSVAKMIQLEELSDPITIEKKRNEANQADVLLVTRNNHERH